MLIIAKTRSHFTRLCVCVRVCVCARSQVDRCHYFHSSMLLDSTKQTNYVCTAKLSERLPLWSNTKQCAECPPLKNFPSATFETAAQFGLIDQHAAVYLDFWSDRHEHLGPYKSLRQSMHDVNGPFESSCSSSRENNADDIAGDRGKGKYIQ